MSEVCFITSPDDDNVKTGGGSHVIIMLLESGILSTFKFTGNVCADCPLWSVLEFAVVILSICFMSLTLDKPVTLVCVEPKPFFSKLLTISLFRDLIDFVSTFKSSLNFTDNAKS